MVRACRDVRLQELVLDARATLLKSEELIQRTRKLVVQSRELVRVIQPERSDPHSEAHNPKPQVKQSGPAQRYAERNPLT